MPSSTWNWPWLISARIDGHAGLVHRRAIAVEPGPAAQDPVRPADDPDPPVPEAEQVAGRRQAAIPVRRPDRRRVVERLAGRVDDDERDPAGPELRPHRVAQVGEDRDDAGRSAGQDALDPAAAGRPAALHLRQDDREVVLPGDALDAADDLQRPLAFEFVEDHLDKGRPARRALGPLIAVLADRGFDPAARLGRHIRAPIDDLGHGRHGDAGLFGDLGYRRGSSGATDLCVRLRGRPCPSVYRKFRRVRMRICEATALDGRTNIAGCNRKTPLTAHGMVPMVPRRNQSQSPSKLSGSAGGVAHRTAWDRRPESVHRATSNP